MTPATTSGRSTGAEGRRLEAVEERSGMRARAEDGCVGLGLAMYVEVCGSDRRRHSRPVAGNTRR